MLCINPQVWLISTWYVRRESQVRMSAFYLISVGISGFR